MGMVFSSTHGQEKRTGLKLGANYSFISGYESYFDNLFSFHIGVMIELPIPESLSIQPELIFSLQGFESTVFNPILF